MTATDELRRLLDERGVAHSDHYLSTTWRDGHGIRHLAGEPMADGSLVVDMLTPEQAIAATLGGGECVMEYATEGMKRGWWVCSECGEASDTIKSCAGIKPPNYCGNCGKAVKR